MIAVACGTGRLGTKVVILLRQRGQDVRVLRRDDGRDADRSSAGVVIVKGKTQVFGRGRNPMNWVSATDVAEFVVRATVDQAMRGEVIEVGGPENLTMTAFVDKFRTETGSSGTVGHIPPVAMRLLGVAMGLVNPAMARQIQMGVIMDARPQAFDASETRQRYPSIPVTSLDEVRSRDFAAARGMAHGSPSVGHV